MEEKRHKKKKRCSVCHSSDKDTTKKDDMHLCGDCLPKYTSGQIPAEVVAIKTKDKPKSKKKKKRKPKRSSQNTDTASPGQPAETAPAEPAAQETAEAPSDEEEEDVFNFAEEDPAEEAEAEEEKPAGEAAAELTPAVSPLSLSGPSEEITEEEWRLEEVNRITEETSVREFEKIVQTAEQAFSDKKKLVSAKDDFKILISSLLNCAMRLDLKVESLAKEHVKLSELKKKQIEALNAILNEQNARLETMAQNNSTASQGPSQEENLFAEMSEMDRNIAKAREETVEWMKRYQEMLAVNENLRKKFDEFAFSENKEEPSKRESKNAMIESDDDYSDEADENQDYAEKHKSPGGANKVRGWFGM